MTFSERYDRALKLAARAHRDQLRKGTDTPYIAHPVHVSVLLLRHGFGEDLAIAGLLHDVVEDCDTTVAELAAEFGPEVARLVEAVSEQKTQDGAELPWQQRKEAKLALLSGGGPDVAALKLADTLHNARSIIADLRAQGADVWRRFKGSPEQTIWYYRQVLAGASSALGDHALARELEQAIVELEEILGARG
jgi:(p)ppGpp synthase/HD superfamily hydrolase